MRFLEFFAASIRNRHTRHANAAKEFLTWCADTGLPSYPGSASRPPAIQTVRQC